MSLDKDLLVHHMKELARLYDAQDSMERVAAHPHTISWKDMDKYELETRIVMVRAVAKIMEAEWNAILDTIRKMLIEDMIAQSQPEPEPEPMLENIVVQYGPPTPVGKDENLPSE